MFKKIIILAVMLLLGVAVSQSQAVILQSPDARVKTAVWVGTDGPTSTNSITLTSANRVLGWTVSGNGAAGIAGLYDATTVGAATNATLFDERACASGSVEPENPWYAAPKNLTNGLVVVTDASTTIVTVFYE